MTNFGINWRQIGVLYRRELRAALRERAIVVNSILLPIFLYPLILWIMFSAITFVEGVSEGFVSRVVLIDLPEEHATLRDSLAAMELVDLRQDPATVDESLGAIREGELDALVEFLPPDSAAARLPGNFSIRVSYDRAEERGRRAEARITDAVREYRDAWLRSQATELGLSPEEFEQFRVARRSITSERQMGAFLLSQMIPLFLVIMVALGCFMPAIDTTAGERERNTWETLMSVASTRLSVVTAKYIYVATLGVTAGVLNVLAMTVSIGAVMRPLLADRSDAFQFSLPLLAVPVMIVGAVMLAMFFAAAMMILASFARKFKEGQAMITPVYWLALVPMLLVGRPELTLTPGLAALPIANVALMIREAINGTFQTLLIAETIVVCLVLVGACLYLAGRVLRFEDYLMGSYDGSFWRFVKDRLLRRQRRAGRKREVRYE